MSSEEEPIPSREEEPTVTPNEELSSTCEDDISGGEFRPGPDGEAAAIFARASACLFSSYLELSHDFCEMLTAKFSSQSGSSRIVQVVRQNPFKKIGIGKNISSGRL